MAEAECSAEHRERANGQNSLSSTQTTEGGLSGGGG